MAVVGLAIVAAYPLIPSEGVQAAVYNLMGITAAVVVGLVASRRGGSRAAAWRLLAIGIALESVGNILYDAMAGAGPVPVPGPPDAAYLLGYLALGAALWQLLRYRGRSSEDLLDTFVIGTAVAVALWILVVDPALDEGTMPLADFAIMAAYPVADVALLALVTVSLLSMERLARVPVLLGAATLAYLASDILYATVVMSDEYAPGLMDIGWFAGYVLWTVAALSSDEGDRQQRDREARRWSRPRMALLVGSAAVPVLLQLLTHGHFDNLVLAGITSLVLFSIVVVRVDIVVRHQARMLDHQRALESTVERQAAEDRLTDLPNRESLRQRLVQMLAAEPAGVALMVVDVDGFGAINELMGSPAGDTTLQVIARRLRAQAAPDDVVARVGGDLFALAIGGGSDEDANAALAERLLTAVSIPVDVGGRTISVSASIGIARSDQETSSSTPLADDLWRDATLALAHAKSTGGHRFVSLGAAETRLAVRRLSLASELGRAVAEREFVLHYQPIVSLRTGRPEAFEALIRWNHPVLGLLMPAEFLPALDRSVHMTAVGRWVLEEACHAAAGWRRHGHEGIGIHINVSAVQLEDDRFVRDVRASLGATSLPAPLLTIEIVESALASSGQVPLSLAALRGLGVGLAVDDFGTGYSSLARVADLHASILKLDRSLVTNAADPRMAEGALLLAQRFGMRVVAEGIETIAELERMRTLGCEAVQGYLTGRPMAIDDASRCLVAEVAQPRRTAGRRTKPRDLARLPSIPSTTVAG